MPTEEELKKTTRGFYPDFPEQVVNDLAHMLRGNAKHVEKRKVEISQNGVTEVNHEEQVVCLGSGFDWLHKPNFALIVNPLGFDLQTPFATQLKLLRENWEGSVKPGSEQKPRIPHAMGMLVMISTSYRKLAEKKHALLKAVVLLDFAQQIIKKDFSDLLKNGLQIIVGTMDANTRLFEQLDKETLKRFSKSNYVAPAELNEVGKFVLEHNKSQHDEFTSRYNIRHLETYRKEHPTEMIVFKCMDGRLNLPIATESTTGVFEPMRNLGAKFHFGWPAFYERTNGLIERAVARGNNVLLIITYHLSKSGNHLGCAGHDYDTEAAKKNAEELAEQARFVYGQGKDSEVNIIVIGFDTDIDAIILHGTLPDQIYDMGEEIRVKGESAPASAS